MTMDMSPYLLLPGERPLDRMAAHGGLCGIFRTMGFIGDSLSSGEFESADGEGNKGYHDFYEYSWGQYIAREAGLKAYNFSRGGMTAKEYWDTFAEANGFWAEDKLCQAYVIALGVNDLFGRKMPVGSAEDICWEDFNRNGETFAGYYARIIMRLRTMQPQARFFLVSMPYEPGSEENDAVKRAHLALLEALAGVFPYTYVLDLYHHAPPYDEAFKSRFYLGGHMNPAGYLLTGRMVASYIDYYIRKDPEAFSQVGFIGTGCHNAQAFW